MRNTCHHHTWLFKGFLGIWTQDLMLEHQGVYWIICLPSHDFIVILLVPVTDAVHCRLKCWCYFYKREFSVAVKHMIVKWKPLLGILSWARALLGGAIAWLKMLAETLVCAYCDIRKASECEDQTITPSSQMAGHQNFSQHPIYLDGFS